MRGEGLNKAIELHHLLVKINDQTLDREAKVEEEVPLLIGVDRKTAEDGRQEVSQVLVMVHNLHLPKSHVLVPGRVMELRRHSSLENSDLALEEVREVHLNSNIHTQGKVHLRRWPKDNIQTLDKWAAVDHRHHNNSNLRRMDKPMALLRHSMLASHVLVLDKAGKEDPHHNSNRCNTLNTKEIYRDREMIPILSRLKPKKAALNQSSCPYMRVCDVYST